MDNYLKSKVDSYLRIKDFNSTHAVQLLTIPDYATEESIFDAALAMILTAGEKQAKELKGIAADSAAAKTAMGEIVIKFARRAAVIARRKKNYELAGQVAHPKTYINRASKLLAIERAKDISKALADNLTIFTNVTAADIANIDAAIKTYEDIQEQPIIKRQARKAEGTDVIPPQVKIADEAVENMYDLVCSYFDNDTVMTDKFELAMEIINTGVHHTGIIAFAVDANPPAGAVTNAMQNVTMKVVELDFIATSDINGLAGIAKIKPGTYHVEFSGAGLKTKTVILNFKRGKMLEVEVEMERVAG